jgi:uncharacterized membrane protein (DUF4010 family)
VGRVKPFLIYTALRFGLFLVTYAVMAGIWFVVFGEGGILLLPFLAAVVISALLSLKLLSRQREQFAAVVQARAERASQRFEEQRSKEDVD